VRLLFLHGAGLTKAMWTPQLEALTGEFDVDAIDLPGHGSRADERFSFPGALDAVAEAAGDGAVLIGLSLGGYVAILAAAGRPELTRGLVLTGSSVDYSHRGDRVVAWTGELFQRVWPKRMLANAQRSAFERRYADVPEVAEAGQYWRGYADALHAARKIRWHDQLDGYPDPVLILNGSLDKTHVRDAEAMVHGVPHGRTQVIEGAGHLANLDRPDEYTRAVREHAALAESARA
jgi:pimeloyl-ACP methyl ester carboxylesterase